MKLSKNLEFTTNGGTVKIQVLKLNNFTGDVTFSVEESGNIKQLVLHKTQFETDYIQKADKDREPELIQPTTKELDYPLSGEVVLTNNSIASYTVNPVENKVELSSESGLQKISLDDFESLLEDKHLKFINKEVETIELPTIENSNKIKFSNNTFGTFEKLQNTVKLFDENGKENEVTHREFQKLIHHKHVQIV